MAQSSEKNDQISGKLLAYLIEELNDSSIAYDDPPVRLQGGYETATYRFKLQTVHEGLTKSLVLRLYPEAYGPENAVWESTIQNALAKEGYPVAKAHFLCKDKSILGGAFFIMDYLAGKPMITAPFETIPEILGKAHAALHSIDPEPLIKSLIKQGVDEYHFRLNNRFDYLQNTKKELPWICDGIDWLMRKRPPEPPRLAICHGDFHPLNILIQDGNVTGVLDWPGFLITDPALDIANSILLMTVPFKHLASSLLGLDFESVDWEMGAQQYLDAYQTEIPFDGTNVEYYRVRRSIHALIEGFRGHQVWHQPLIVRDLIGFIYQATDIRISIPV